MYSINYSPTARNALKKMSPNVTKRIIFAVQDIKSNPHSHLKILKYSNRTPIYSLFVGPYRIIMIIKDDKLMIFVIMVEHRTIFYRKC